MQNRVDSKERGGGDVVQMYKTADGLRKIGFEVDFDFSLRPDLKGYDIVHLFNISRIHETAMQARNCLAQGTPYVVSTIYQDLREYDQLGRYGFDRFLHRLLPTETLERLRAVARGARDPRQLSAAVTMSMRGYHACQIEVLRSASALLPNSRLEADALQAMFGTDLPPIHSIVNGIDLKERESRINLPEELVGQRFVLSVGRVEPIKNQLAIIRALQGTGLRLVLVGGLSNNHPSYVQTVLKELKDSGGLYLGILPYDTLQGIYSFAKCHVLASWFETTGLVSLEALAQGCPVISTDRGYTKEYLEGLAVFCQPSEIESIREAVISAHLPAPIETIKDYVSDRYTWDRAAQQTKQVYINVLNANE